MSVGIGLNRGMNFSPAALVGGGGGGGGGSFLDSIISGVEAEWRADQYSGSGDWLNLTASPQSGASQTDYDLAAVGDPTFSTDEWQLDGTDGFSIGAGNNTTFLNTMGRTDTNQQTWMIVAYYQGSTLLNNDTLMSTKARVVGEPSLRIEPRSTGAVKQQQYGDSTSASTTTVATGLITTSTDLLVIMGVDLSATTGNADFWVNTDTALTYDHGSVTSTTADTSDGFCIGCDSAGTPGRFLPSGCNLYAAAIGAGTLSNANAAAIRDYYETALSKTF